jgi:hypothetical protein
MNLTGALKEIESHIASRGSAGGFRVLEALECIVEAAIPPSSNVAKGNSLHKKEKYDYDESEYAVEVALNLSKRSDPCYQTYFKVLSDMGVSIDGVHNRVYAARSIKNLCNDLYHPEISVPVQRMKDFCGESGVVRLPVECSEWFQVCYLLFRLARQYQEQLVEIVCDAPQLPSTECFLEIRAEPTESIRLYVGMENTQSTVFLSALWNALDLVSRRVGRWAAPHAELLCSRPARGLLVASCQHGSFRRLSTTLPCVLLGATPSLPNCELLVSAVLACADEETRSVLRRVGCWLHSLALFTAFQRIRHEQCEKVDDAKAKSAMEKTLDAWKALSSLYDEEAVAANANDDLWASIVGLDGPSASCSLTTKKRRREEDQAVSVPTRAVAPKSQGSTVGVAAAMYREGRAALVGTPTPLGVETVSVQAVLLDDMRRELSNTSGPLYKLCREAQATLRGEGGAKE